MESDDFDETTKIFDPGDPHNSQFPPLLASNSFFIMCIIPTTITELSGLEWN